MGLEDGKVEGIMGLTKTEDPEEALWKPTNLEANFKKIQKGSLN